MWVGPLADSHHQYYRQACSARCAWSIDVNALLVPILQCISCALTFEQKSITSLVDERAPHKCRMLGQSYVFGSIGKR